MMSNNFSNESQARKQLITALESKYHVKFTLDGNEKYGKNKDDEEEGEGFMANIKDANGLVAHAALYHNKFIGDNGLVDNYSRIILHRQGLKSC